MGKSKLKGKDLRKINYESDKARSLAIDIMSRHFKHLSKADKLTQLAHVLSHPNDYLNHKNLAPLAREFAPVVELEQGTSYRLREQAVGFKVYGKKNIDSNTVHQMELAMRLPIAEAGALMPDAHVGYGLPIGAALATKNAVIPYGVGMDIGCRMSMSLLNIPASYLHNYNHRAKMALKEQTHFGLGCMQDTYEEHEVLDSNQFKATELLRRLHGKAKGQIGTSGSGNHFVEVGILALEEGNPFEAEAGEYIGIMAHSGSRGFGASIASYYTDVARQQCYLPKGAQHLAWLDLDTEAGQEYWLSMQLAGEYAKACHDVIHRKMARAIGAKVMGKVENHHNFAWKETHADGVERIVHRKGATPAAKGEPGIIPGTMLSPAYVVTGRGEALSLNSASHGAGRKWSRGKAKSTITRSSMNKELKQAGVSLIGGQVDEAPMAYKDIEAVMGFQKELVNVHGKFFPKIVRMDKG